MIHIGDYVSLWRTSTSSHPRFWLEVVGQVTGYRISEHGERGRITVTVAVSTQNTLDVTLIALSLQRAEVDLSGTQLLRYMAYQSVWACSGVHVGGNSTTETLQSTHWWWWMSN